MANKKITDVDVVSTVSDADYLFVNQGQSIKQIKKSDIPKPIYTAEEVGADAAGTAESKVSAHNVSDAAHNDIRLLVQGLTDRLNALADSDDTTLDQMSEVVAYIKSNKSLIDAITTGKVSVSDIVNNLTTNVSNKPLSAAQGVKLKALIDAITSVELDETLTDNTKAAPAGMVGELKSEIDQLKQAGTGSGSGVTVAQSNSLWAIIQKAAFAEALTDEELNDFKTAWGITTENIPATGITLDKSTLSFTDSATQTLIATIEPSNSTDKVTWESSDAGIATVSGGVVTPISNGSCTITAKAGSYSATCAVTVDIAEEGQVTLTSISATYTGGDVAVGTALTDLIGITVTGIYSDGSTSAITGYTLSGTIAEGSNTITVSYGGKTTTFTVTGVVESGGGEVTAELPTDGLVAYFDFRNTTPEINTKQGFTKFNANQGNGCLFTWSASAFTSSDDYGVKRMARSFMFDKDGGTNQSELGTSFTMLFKGYNVVNGAFVSNDHTGASNVSVFFSKPKYNTSSGQLQVGQENIENTQWSGYIDAYFVADGEVFKVYINGELIKTYTGTDYEDFVSWYSKVTTTVFGDGNYQTALALYGKALSEVEIVEARAFLQTLEVA